MKLDLPIVILRFTNIKKPTLTSFNSYSILLHFMDTGLKWSCIYNYVVCPDIMKVKKKLPVLVVLLSAIQSPFDINFPRSLGYIRNYRSGLHGETISLPVCLQPTYGAQEYSTSSPSQGTNSLLGSNGDSEIHFRVIHIRPV